MIKKPLQICFLYMKPCLVWIHPGPRTELVKVVGLRHSGLVSSAGESFRTTVSWQKPLFNHSTVQHYRYKISNISSKTVGKKTRRAIDFDTDLTTVSEVPETVHSSLFISLFIIWWFMDLQIHSSTCVGMDIFFKMCLRSVV